MLNRVAIIKEVPRAILKKYCMSTPILSMYGAGLAKKIIRIADIIPDFSPKCAWKWSGIETNPFFRMFGAIKKA